MVKKVSVYVDSSRVFICFSSKLKCLANVCCGFSSELRSNELRGDNIIEDACHLR